MASAAPISSLSTFFTQEFHLRPSSRPLSLSHLPRRPPSPVLCATSKANGTSTAPRTGRGLTKPLPLSPEMQALLGVPEVSRAQALKLIWAHIKQHELQDPLNKKIIICDDKLKSVFGGRDQVGFLEIAGLISPHFLK